MSSKYSRVCAEIDMDAIAENFRIMHEAIHPETKMVAVIKTDGYGHGAVPIAQMIQPEDYIWGFAVATMTEAMILRKNHYKTGADPGLYIRRRLRRSDPLRDPTDCVQTGYGKGTV